MELMQFEMFAAVLEEGSERDAAERVFRTQPAVSIAISKLEREFEAPLLDRSRRHEYCLTQMGEALYQYATRMLSLRRETLSVISELCNLLTGRVRIGANESVNLHLLPKLAQAFLNEHSGIRMEVKCDRSKSPLAEPKARSRAAFVLAEDKELDSKFVMKDELVLITSPMHAFADKGRVNIKGLSGQSLMVMDVLSLRTGAEKSPKRLCSSKRPGTLRLRTHPLRPSRKWWQSA